MVDSLMIEQAQYELQHAVKKGRIIKPNTCSSCGEIKNIEAHHPDYDKPLEVIWLCHKCHMNLHEGIKGMKYKLREKRKRSQQIRRFHETHPDWALAEIGDKFNLSKQRVSQILGTK